MTLYMIGIGLFDEKDISVRGLEMVKMCDKVFLEYYTSKLSVSAEQLSSFYGKDVVVSSRELVEKGAEEILEPALNGDVAFLVVGDIFSATTHMDLFLRAKEKGITVEVAHNASVMTAIGATGLELYKFGKTTSIPYPEENWVPETAYDVIKDNHSLGYHTLCLLDIKADRGRFMSVSEAIDILRSIEEKRGEGVLSDATLCIGCARLGTPTQKIVCGTFSELVECDLGEPLHCLIVPGKLHFVEEEMLEQWKN